MICLKTRQTFFLVGGRMLETFQPTVAVLSKPTFCSSTMTTPASSYSSSSVVVRLTTTRTRRPSSSACGDGYVKQQRRTLWSPWSQRPAGDAPPPSAQIFPPPHPPTHQVTSPSMLSTADATTTSSSSVDVASVVTADPLSTHYPTPFTFMAKLLRVFHDSWGIPLSVVIIGYSVAICCLTLPFFVSVKRVSVWNLHATRIRNFYKRKVSDIPAAMLTSLELTGQVQAILKDQNERLEQVHPGLSQLKTPWNSLLFILLVHWPAYLGLILYAKAYPAATSSEGLIWITSLAQPDQVGVLPIATGLALTLVVIGLLPPVVLAELSPSGKLQAQGASVLTLPLVTYAAMSLPAYLQLYLVVVSWGFLLQQFALDHPALRARFVLPGNPSDLPYTEKEAAAAAAAAGLSEEKGKGNQKQ